MEATPTLETTRRRPQGRPPLPVEVRRMHPLRTHVDTALHNRAVAYAREQGTPISHLIAQALELLLAEKGS